MSAAGAIAAVLERERAEERKIYEERKKWLKKADEAPTAYLFRKYRKKAAMCKGDSEPPSPPTRPPRMRDERVQPFRVEGRDMPSWTDYVEGQKTLVERNPPGTIINYKGDRWMTITGHGLYKNCATGDEQYISYVTERECVTSPSADIPPTPEAEKEEPSYREQYVSPEIVDLRKQLARLRERADSQFEMIREQATHIDKLEAAKKITDSKADIAWKIFFFGIGGAIIVVSSGVIGPLLRTIEAYFR